MRVEIIETPDLGNRSYVVHDGTHAVVIDPQRDLDRVEQLLERLDVDVCAVAETHIHNDYVSGGLALARRHGADYLVQADEPAAFAFRPVSDDQVISLGGLDLRVLATPGHTPRHVSYVIGDQGGAALFSGGSLLYGAVGRTDLIGADLTEALAHQQVRSAHRLAAELDPGTLLFPTHGFGSFCSAGSCTGSASGTLADELAAHPVFRENPHSYAAALAGADLPIPAHYPHMAPLNLAGPSASAPPSATLLSRDALADRVHDGAWIVDIRHRSEALPTRLRGSIHVELGGQFATYAGWVVPWGERITLVGDSMAALAEADRQLSRIGIDHTELALYDAALPADLHEPLPVRSFADVRNEPRGSLIDVRTEAERASARVIGSQHVPFHRMQETSLPGGELWVHCKVGFRALVAASLLARQGRDVGVIDDDFARTESLGLLAS